MNENTRYRLLIDGEKIQSGGEFRADLTDQREF